MVTAVEQNLNYIKLTSALDGVMPIPKIVKMVKEQDSKE